MTHLRNTMTRKGYGRIYVQKDDAILAVEGILRDLDEYEFDGYYPKGLVAHFSKYPEVIYLYKFDDICMNQLTAICWKKGIAIWVFDNGDNAGPTDLTIREAVE